jgi:protein TonB
MFDNLIESKASKQKRTGGTFFSFVFHTIVITGAVVGTLHAKNELEMPEQEKVEFVQVKKDEPPPPKEEPKPPPPDVVAAPPPPKGFQILTAPIKIPDVIPDVDLNKAVTREEDFTGRGAQGGTAKGVIGGTPAPLQQETPFFDFQVEQQAKLAPGNKPPDYPSQLRATGVEGSVTVQFVVDTAGRVDISTYKLINSTHALFETAVKNHLKDMRYIPAEIGGRKVKQLVQQPFTFSLSR